MDTEKSTFYGYDYTIELRSDGTAEIRRADFAPVVLSRLVAGVLENTLRQMVDQQAREARKYPSPWVLP